MTDSAPTMDGLETTKAPELTPSKRRRTSSSPTPATTQAACVLPLRGTSLARFAADVGALAAATARHGKFMAAELYGPLVTPEHVGGWARLDAHPPSGGEAVTWLALDVEMCERRKDGVRFPVSACVTRTRWEASPDGVRAAQETLFDGLINPGDELNWWDDHQAQLLDWKDSIHGLKRSAHVAARKDLASIQDVQRLIVSRFDDTSFLVGHKLCADLQVLKIKGLCLKRRTIDTMLLHWGPRASAPGVRALLAEIDDNQVAGKAHDAAADVAATIAVAFFDVKRLTQGLDIGPAFAPAPLLAADDRQKCRVEIPERMVGRIIGKRGATLAKIRESCPQVFIEVASKQHELKDTRLVTMRAQASADIARCLDFIAAKVPDLQPVTDVAKTDLLEDVGVLRGGSSFRAV